MSAAKSATVAAASAQAKATKADHDWKNGKPPSAVCRLIKADGTWSDVKAPPPFNAETEEGGFQLKELYTLLGVKSIGIVHCSDEFLMVVDDEGMLKSARNKEASRLCCALNNDGGAQRAVAIYGDVLFCHASLVG